MNLDQALETAKAAPLILTERTTFGEETAAGIMRNRCAFTSRDMGADWPEAFTYAIVLGWDDDEDEPHPNNAMLEVAERYGWDAELVGWLRNAHEEFKQLAERPRQP